VCARFTLGLAKVQAIGALVACRKLRETRMEGGNIRLVQDMIYHSSVDFQFQSEVSSVNQGQKRRYRFCIADNSDGLSLQNLEFDAVILAGPVDNISMIDIAQ
jgi:hypothetical protein